jgi:hypothetical protein
MNINKSILVAALTLGVSGLAYAGNVYISGSTAMRGNVYNTLNAAGAVFTAKPVVTYDGSSASGSSHMVFYGTLKGGSGGTYIYCSWSGSEGGIANVVSNTASAFYAGFIPQGVVATSGGDTKVSSFTAENKAVDLAMVDNSQAYSKTTKPTVTGQKLAVITFEWVRNPGLWTGGNVSDQMIQQTLGGYCPRSVFDGDTNHVSDYVYVSGRDNLSGTRVNAFGTSGYGIFTPPVQIILNNGNMVQDLINGDGNNYNYYAGDMGQGSGGTLAGTMGVSTVGKTDQVNGGTSGFSAIAYLGYNDAATAVTAGATVLTYNGVAFSTNAVIEGNYTFWGNEYIYKANTMGSTDATTVYNSLVTEIPPYCTTAAALPLTAMHSTRSAPVGAPKHK